MLAGASIISIVLGVVMAPTGVEMGTVESITLGYTVLRTFENRRVVLPNSLASSQTTVNLSSVDERIMAAVPIGIAYDADVHRAREILIGIARAHPDVVEAVGCPVIQLGASSITLSVRAWCKDAAAAHRFEWDAYEQAKAQFATAGVEIPYPYQNIIMKGEG